MELEVSGLSEAVDTDFLILYLESARRSGGGPVSSYTRSGSEALVTFENLSDAENVLCKEEHRVQSVSISVRRPPPWDPGKVALCGLHPETEESLLELYVEKVSGREEFLLLRSPDRTTTLITFPEPLSPAEFEQLERSVQSRCVHGSSPSVQRVRLCADVLVDNLGGLVSAELLEMYFESRRSGGGSVISLTMLNNDSAAVVSFSDVNVATRVLSRSHCLQSCTLTVSPYYPTLMGSPSVGDTGPPEGKHSEDSKIENMEGSGDGLQEPTTNLKSENMEVQEETERDCQEEVWSDPVTEQLPEDQARETEQNICPCEAEKTEEVTQENMKTRDDPPWRATQDADVLMESSELRFLQEYHHELLAGMDQVTIVPLEAQDRCGFKVAGDTFSCRTAVELLHHVVSSLSSRAVTLQYPGVSLFLLEDEGQRSILETERQYQCIIDTSRLSWKVTGCKDVDPWRFVDVSGADSSPVQSYMVEDVSEAAGTRRAADIEDIKAFASLLKNSKSEDNKEVSATTIDLIIKKDDDEVDLYSDPKGQEEDASETGDEELEQVCKMSRDEFTDRELDEEAQLLLAIQMSMDTQDAATEEQDLQKALELSLREQVMEEVEEPLQRALEMSLRNSWARADDETFPSEEDDVSGDEMARAVNTAEIKVLAGDETGLVVACTAIRKAITGQLCTVTLGGARDLRYGAQILSALERKHKVTITVQDGQAQIQGFLQNPLKCQEELSQILRALHAGGRSHGGIVTLDQQQTSILIPVSEKSAEYGRVMELFTSTLQDLKPLTRVLQVQKVQNTLLYNQYQLKKQSMLGHCPRTPIERTLYHGTTEDGAKEICHHGFDRSFCGKNATLFGQGVYFAVHSAVSARDIYSPPSSEGHKYILVAQVLTGEFTLGKADMKTPPIKLDPGDDVPQRYDSLTNNLQKPSVFVIFNDTQAYPQYLITCCNQKN